MSKPVENKMGIMPMNKLIISMSLPMMASMLIQALYNIVDSMFVAQICEEALTALSLAFPVQNLMIGFATGTGVGMNAMLSKSLGEKDFEKVKRAASNGFCLEMFAWVLFLIFGIFGSRLFFSIQTDNQLIIDYGTQYVSICAIGSIFLYLQITFERYMQATGKTVLSMITQGVGAIINIALDPILIFVFGLDVVGAALATVSGQAVSAIVGIYLNRKLNPEVKFRFRQVRLHWPTIKRIYSVGIPSIVMMAIGSVMNFTLNSMLINFFSETAATVLGVYYKIQSFVFMPLFGMNNGIIPIIAYNYGAGKRSRILRCIKLTVVYATGLMIIGLLIYNLLPVQLLQMFDASQHMIEIGVPAFRIISISYIFAGFCIVMGSVFQAFGKGVLSMIVSICRQLVVLVPSAFILSMLFRDNVNMFWFSFPIAEIMSVTISSICLAHIYKKIIKKIPDNV